MVDALSKSKIRGARGILLRIAKPSNEPINSITRIAKNNTSNYLFQKLKFARIKYCFSTFSHIRDK